MRPVLHLLLFRLLLLLPALALAGQEVPLQRQITRPLQAPVQPRTDTPPAKPSYKPVRITMLHVNDVYQISPVDKGTAGGLARLASLKKQLQAESPNLLFTLGGDTLSPSVASNTFKGAQMIATWNAAGLDMAVFGNHEFDFGPEVLQARMQESRFPWLGANVRDKTGKALFAKTVASELRTFEDIKVGILGVVTASTAQSSKPGPDVRFEEPVAEARREAGRLRAKGANVVVALTHLDMAEDRKLADTGAVDLILGGHEHALMQSLAGHTPIFKAGSDARLAARVDIWVDALSRRVSRLDWQMLPVDTSLPDEPGTAQVVAGFEKQLSELLDKPVGKTAVALDARQNASRSRETNLGNWLADTYRSRTGADMAILNGGTIRSNATYGPGMLTRRDLLSILPFETPIVKLDVTGKVVRAALEHGLALAADSAESGRFPQVSGIRLAFDPRKPPGSRLTMVTVNGAPLDDDRRYSLATSAYLAGGGDGYIFFKDRPFLISPENAQTETAEAIEALASGSPIAPVLDGRILRLNP